MVITLRRIFNILKRNRTNRAYLSHFGILLGLYGATVAFISIYWRDLLIAKWHVIDTNLILIQLGLFILLLLGADFTRDAKLIIVSTIGGWAIETWGTRLHLWHYFTNEAPPFWIVPAWPIATLATHTLARVFFTLCYTRLKTLGRRMCISVLGQKVWGFETILYFALMIFFLTLFLYFGRFHLNRILFWITFLATLVFIFSARKSPLYYSAYFLIGSLVGYPLEFWGTTHNTWVYYSREMPPLFAPFAHGFATVVFQRCVHLIFYR